MIGGFDFSTYQAGITAAAIGQAVAAQGPIVTIEGRSNAGPSGVAGSQVLEAVQVTDDVSMYVLINWEQDLPGSTQVVQAMEAISSGGFNWHRLLFIAIDVETYPGWEQSGIEYRIPRMLEAIQQVRDYGLYPIVYTNNGMWTTVMGGTPQDWGIVVNQTELWLATEDKTPDLGPVSRALPWSPVAIVGEQYDAGEFGGYSIDQNVWSDSFITARRAEREARLHPVVPVPAPTPTPTPIPEPQPEPLPPTPTPVPTPTAVNQIDYTTIRAIVREELDRTKLGS